MLERLFGGLLGHDDRHVRIPEGAHVAGGGAEFSDSWLLGATRRVPVSDSTPNGILVSISDDGSVLPQLAELGVNLALVQMPRPRGESHDAYRDRLLGVFTRAQGLGIAIVPAVNWYFSLVQVSAPLSLSAAPNPASSFPAGRYDCAYTYTDAHGRECFAKKVARASITLADGQELRLVAPATYTTPTGFTSTIQGWNLYIRWGDGPYVCQNQKPIVRRAISVSRLRQEGPPLPPYNRTLTPDTARIDRNLPWMETHPNVFGYFILDEPSSLNLGVEEMRALYGAFRPHTRRPLLVNFAEMASSGNRELTGERASNPYDTGICDIPLVEVYPYKQVGPPNYHLWTQDLARFKGVLASAHGYVPPFWAMAQGHATDAPIPLSYVKRPNYAQMFRQASDVFREGGSGIVWYVWDKEVTAPQTPPHPGGIKDNPSASRFLRDLGHSERSGQVTVADYARAIVLRRGARLVAPATDQLGADAGTVSFWTNPIDWHGGDNAERTLFEWGENGSRDVLSIIKTRDNRLQWRLRNSNDGREAIRAVASGHTTKPQREPTFYRPKWFPHAWYHLVLTYERGESLKLYLDGRLIGAAPTGHGVGFGAPPDCFFGAAHDGGRPAGGRYGEIRLYNHALSEAEVFSLMESVPGS